MLSLACQALQAVFYTYVCIGRWPDIYVSELEKGSKFHVWYLT